jgi:hypothetical protein
MAKLADATITIRVNTTVSFWDALKLRLSGAGYAIKRRIEIDLEELEDNAAERDRLVS